MQICFPRIFGKRRHSGDLEGQSQLKMAFLFIILRSFGA
jgi:hypothetical protein